MKDQGSRWRNRLLVDVVLTVAVMLVPTGVFGQVGQVLPRRDFQAWMSFDGTHPLSKKVDFLLGAGIRYGNLKGHLSYRRVTTGFAFRWHKFFTFEPYYQYAVIDSHLGPLTPEHRLAMQTTVGVPWRRWLISDRNRGERNFKPGLKYWRYRNRLELQRPIVLVHKTLTAFAWDEVYYSSVARRWYRNRFALGVQRRLSRRLAVDIFYVHQNDGYSHPGDLDGLGLTVHSQF